MPAHMRPLAKPAKGTAQKLRRARRRLVETRERAAKDAAKLRDGYRCRRCGEGQVSIHMDGRITSAMEAAHLVNKGMGGDHGRHSHHQRDYVTLCPNCHRGPRSVHSGHVEIVFGARGGDGPVRFIDATPKRLLAIRVEHDA
jgi:hypothetical protein